MNEHNLSKFQLFAIIFLFVGASSLYGLPYEAKQDVWLVYLLSLGFGLLIGVLYLLLFYNTKMTLPQLLVYLFGHKLGAIFALVYGIFFLYEAAKNIRSMSYLLINSFLYEASPLLISFVIILLIYFFVFAGIETLARSSFIFAVLTIISLICLGLIGLLTKSYEWSYLFPMKEKSISELVKIAFPVNTVYPYGELLGLTALVPLSLFKKRRYFLYSLFLSGLKLMIVAIVVIVTLSPFIASNAVYPAILAVSQFQISSFTERLDPIAVNLFTTALVFKIIVFVYAAHACFGITYRVRKTKVFSYITAPLLLFLSVYISKSNLIHYYIMIKKVVWPYHVPLEILFPCIMLLFLLLKGKKKQAEQNVV
ncbi:MAG: GerAB/ArcD/ProY family transporter [Bacillaceae bacterium]